MRTRGVLLLILFAAVACGRENGSLSGVIATPSPTPEPTFLALPSEEPTASPTPEATETPEPSATPAATVTVTTEPSPTATPVPECVNSTQPKCGAFHFEPPAPVDHPVTVTVKVSPSKPKAGQKVTFTLHATDPDSHLLNVGSYKFSSNGPGATSGDFPGNCPVAYGRWDPPSSAAGDITKKLEYTYNSEGTYKASFQFQSRSYSDNDNPWQNVGPGDHDGVCIDPLSSSGRTEVKVTVTK